MASLIDMNKRLRARNTYLEKENGVSTFGVGIHLEQVH